MQSSLRPLLTIALASILVLVQTAAPWLHQGCEHDHSTATDQVEHSHDNCFHHCHLTTDPDRAAVEHSHPEIDHDCATCRHLSQSTTKADGYAPAFCELAVELPQLSSTLLVETEPFRLYRSRAPPRLS